MREVKEGRILAFTPKKDPLEPQMAQVLQLLRESVNGYTHSEVGQILGRDPASALSRLRGGTNRHRSGNSTKYPRLIETRYKRRCAVTGKSARVWSVIQ